jgi:Ca2+-binding EF-hand superfamily protein
MANLPQDNVDEARSVFETFDKRYEGKVDALHIGDMLRSLNLAPTETDCRKRGQTTKSGEKFLTFEEFLPIYAEFFKMPEKYFGTLEDFQEGLKLYDKESNGQMSLAELSQVLVAMADKLPVDYLEDILRSTDTKEDGDGNINYDNFSRKVLAGPFPKD